MNLEGPLASRLADSLAFLEKALLAAVAVAISVFVAVLLRNAMRRWVKHLLPSSVYRPLENAVFYAVLFLGCASALQPLGVDLTGLLVAGGVAGIVIGFASQQVVSNLISGLFLFIERPFAIGEPVNIEGIAGQVVDVNVFSTVIRTWDGYIVRLPNAKVFEALIQNYRKTRARRVELKVGISYSSSIEAARQAIMKVIEDHPYCLVNPAPEVFVDEFADSAVVLTVRCWTHPDTWFETKKSLLEQIKKAFEEVGVEIPFPQLDLHIKDSTAITVRVEGAPPAERR